MQVRPTRSVLDIVARLEGAGFEAWCVGGAIRDSLLGGRPLDWDIATSARPEQVRDLFGRKRTIPVGIEFGTVCVLDHTGIGHEVTTFRRDVHTDGRHAVVEFGASLDDDLARRDFTMNAIAFRPSTAELRDPFGGRQDIANRIVRAVGTAADRMREDRLRALRAIRFAARYHFIIEGETWAAVRSSAPHMKRLSAERVQQELVKCMQQVDCPASALRLWKESGVLAVLIPALNDIGDVALETLNGLARDGEERRSMPQRTSNRIAALFVDLPAAEVRRTMADLRFSKHETNWAVSIAAAWKAVMPALAPHLAEQAASDAEVRRWLAIIGRLRIPAFFRIAHARWRAEREVGLENPHPQPVRIFYRRIMAQRFAGAIEIADLAIGGDDLRAAGIPPGPLYAKILHALLDQVLDHPARNTPSVLLEEAATLAERFQVSGNPGPSTD